MLPFRLQWVPPRLMSPVGDKPLRGCHRSSAALNWDKGYNKIITGHEHWYPTCKYGNCGFIWPLTFFLVSKHVPYWKLRTGHKVRWRVETVQITFPAAEIGAGTAAGSNFQNTFDYSAFFSCMFGQHCKKGIRNSKWFWRDTRMNLSKLLLASKKARFRLTFGKNKQKLRKAQLSSYVYKKEKCL